VNSSIAGWITAAAADPISHCAEAGELNVAQDGPETSRD
jgi:hypothetical protein